MRGLLPLLAAVVVAGCVGPTSVVQQYAGPPRPPETLAILRLNGKEPFRLVMLDGEDVQSPLAEDARLHVELLPGRHSVVVLNTKGTPPMPETLPFDAAAGHVYRPVLVAGTARLFEVERGSDRPRVDMTLPSPDAASPQPSQSTTLPPPD